jgi:tetratricopeptide (TPR) repeat protein
VAGLVLIVACLAVWRPALAQVSEADVFVAEAVLAIDDKQWDKALDLLRQALARAPGHVEALYYTGVAHLGKRQPKAAIPPLTQAYQAAPNDPSVAYQLGLAYFALEQYDRAEPLLESVFARDPTLPSLGYYVGFLRYRKNKYEEALRAFRASQTSDPDIADLTRIYAGLSLQKLGLGSQAEAEIAQLGKLRPALPITGPAERVQSNPGPARDTDRRFRAEVRFGGFYDDNAPAAPSVTGASVPAGVGEGRRNTFGELLSVRLDYDWLRAGGWIGTGGFSFFGTHNNSLPDFDLQDYSGSLNIVRRALVFNLPVLAGVSYTYDHVVLDNERLLERNAIAAYGVLVESDRQLTTGQLRVDFKNYKDVERSDHEFTNIVRVEVPLPWFVPDQQLFLTGEYTGKIANSNIEVFQYRRNFGAIYFTWQY